MWPVSSAYLAAVRASAQEWDVRCTLTGSAGTRTAKISAGSVSVDVGRSVRRTLSCQLTFDSALVPRTGNDLLAPFGTEALIERGQLLPDGTYEWVPLGVFVLDNVDLEDEGSGGTPIAISAQDRSLRITRNRWATPWAIAPGTLVVDAIRDLLEDRWADVECAFGDLSSVITGSYTFPPGGESDPWRDAVKVAEDFGMDLSFNAAGIAVLQQIPELSTTEPVITYTDGTDAVLTKVHRNLSMEGRFNGVIGFTESGEATTVVVAQAWDTDPSSPTRVDGPLGPVPRFLQISGTTDPVQAQATVDAALRKELGATEAIDWAQIVNAAHDGYDVVAVSRTSIGVDANFVLDTLTIPLGSGTMSATARTRTALTV